MSARLDFLTASPARREGLAAGPRNFAGRLAAAQGAAPKCNRRPCCDSLFSGCSPRSGAHTHPSRQARSAAAEGGETYMDWVKTILETSPLTALFLTIAVGYVVGGLNLKGFALGSGAVLFVGLACGAFAPKSAPAGMVGTLGLLLFLYCMGVQYGREWYRGLTSAEGLKANFTAVCGLTAAVVVSLVIYGTGAANLSQALGMFAGSATSTS